ncbi:MAG: hypothetical protein RI948_397 [Bacteroidota bacterium]
MGNALVTEKDFTTAYSNNVSQIVYSLAYIYLMNLCLLQICIQTTCHCTYALPQEEYMISENSNQGKFHLLAILLIPVNLVSVFLMPTYLWWAKALIIGGSVVFTFLVLKKKSS